MPFLVASNVFFISRLINQGDSLQKAFVDLRIEVATLASDVLRALEAAEEISELRADVMNLSTRRPRN